MTGKREDLRRRRLQLGLTQEGAAFKIGVSYSTYRGWEAGTRGAGVTTLPDIARGFDVSVAEVHRWFDERAAAPDGMAVPEWLGTYAALEQGAAAVWSFEPMVVPGLLQTAAYATALESHRVVRPSGNEIDSSVSLRMARQEALHRETGPLELSAIIDESVLYRSAGSHGLMAAQLTKLTEMTQRPNVEVQILPLHAGISPAGFGSFTVLTSPGSPRPYMACVLDCAGPHYLDRSHELNAHIDLFRHLQNVALSANDSAELIRTVIKERYP